VQGKSVHVNFTLHFSLHSMFVCVCVCVCMYVWHCVQGVGKLLLFGQANTGGKVELNST